MQAATYHTLLVHTLSVQQVHISMNVCIKGSVCAQMLLQAADCMSLI